MTMADNPVFCGVILAAGESSRMGRDKALLAWPPSSQTDTLLSANIAALRPFTAEVLVVAGHNAAQLAPIVAASRALLVVNPAPERGQFSSLQTGLQELISRGWNEALITPVDIPPLSAASLDNLCKAFSLTAARGKWAVAPERNGRRGHPLAAGRALIDAFLNAAVTSNAREVRNAYADRISFCPVPDMTLGRDLNTPEQYAAALQID